jgi:hypothetical protein
VPDYVDFSGLQISLNPTQTFDPATNQRVYYLQDSKPAEYFVLDMRAGPNYGLWYRFDMTTMEAVEHDKVLSNQPIYVKQWENVSAPVSVKSNVVPRETAQSTSVISGPGFVATGVKKFAPAIAVIVLLYFFSR